MSCQMISYCFSCFAINFQWEKIDSNQICHSAPCCLLQMKSRRDAHALSGPVSSPLIRDCIKCISCTDGHFGVHGTHLSLLSDVFSPCGLEGGIKGERKEQKNKKKRTEKRKENKIEKREKKKKKRKHSTGAAPHYKCTFCGYNAPCISHLLEWLALKSSNGFPVLI